VVVNGDVKKLVASAGNIYIKSGLGKYVRAFQNLSIFVLWKYGEVFKLCNDGG
jgi:hypothetical protein